MKNGKNPTVAQKKLLQSYGLQSGDWLVIKDTPEKMELVHRSDRSTKKLPKTG